MFWSQLNWHNRLSILIILGGAALLFLAIQKQKELFNAVPFIRARHRPLIIRFLKLGKILMFTFLGGYLIVALAFAKELAIIGHMFVSIVFFLGAIFVLLGIALNARILAEIQTTLQGLLPICFNCKKIRLAGTDPGQQQSWTEIESFISRHSDATFSHGLCPTCLEEMRQRKK